MSACAWHRRLYVAILPIHLDEIISGSAGELSFDHCIPWGARKKSSQPRRVFDAEEETLNAAHLMVICEPRVKGDRLLSHADDANPWSGAF